MPWVDQLDSHPLEVRQVARCQGCSARSADRSDLRVEPLYWQAQCITMADHQGILLRSRSIKRKNLLLEHAEDIGQRGPQGVLPAPAREPLDAVTDLSSTPPS